MANDISRGHAYIENHICSGVLKAFERKEMTKSLFPIFIGISK